MTDNTVYWVWLQQVMGIGVNVEHVLNFFLTAKNVYDATYEEKENSKCFTNTQLDRTLKIPIALAEDIIAECELYGYCVVTPEDEEYPEQLLSIKNYPLAIYYEGDIEILKNRLSIGVVGTRRATERGINIAGRLSSEICKSGAVVVSGGALGIDGAAHMGAVAADGKTAAVLGCGLNTREYRDSVYANRDEILKHGVILTEFPPDVKAIGRNFPVRNRIISGISHGVLVVEAEVKSGSLITAELAIKQKRPLFAVPGDVLDKQFSGTMKLIREGATPVFSSYDILAPFVKSHPKLIKEKDIDKTELYSVTDNFDFSKITYEAMRKEKSEKKNKLPEQMKMDFESSQKDDSEIKRERERIENLVSSLNEDERLVYDCITDEPQNIDMLLMKIKLPIFRLNAIISILEMKDMINTAPGKYFTKK